MSGMWNENATDLYPAGGNVLWQPAKSAGRDVL